MSSSVLSQDLQNVFAEPIDMIESAVLGRVGSMALGTAKPVDVLKSLMSAHVPEFQVVVDHLLTSKLPKNLAQANSEFVSLLVTFVVAPGICPAYRRWMIPANVFQAGLVRKLLEAAKNGHITLPFSAQAMFIEMGFLTKAESFAIASGVYLEGSLELKSALAAVHCEKYSEDKSEDSATDSGLHPQDRETLLAMRPIGATIENRADYAPFPYVLGEELDCR